MVIFGTSVVHGTILSRPFFGTMRLYIYGERKGEVVGEMERGRGWRGRTGHLGYMTLL